ncbi:MAG: hypothetical protein K5928_01970 [Prevotella sp.]|nr:hypothetical protein [Prevotella sp.]
MLSPNQQKLTTFETRVRQMLLHYQELKKENVELYAMLSESERQQSELKAKVQQLGDDLERLRMAKMLTITNGELVKAKERITALVKEVNKCIALLKEAQ